MLEQKQEMELILSSAHCEVNVWILHGSVMSLLFDVVADVVIELVTNGTLSELMYANDFVFLESNNGET